MTSVDRVKPLEWRVPRQDDPRDPDAEDTVFCADGIGGLYAISRKQKLGPERLLWWAHDPMLWTGFDTIDQAKAAAQADYSARILSALAPVEAEPVVWRWRNKANRLGGPSVWFYGALPNGYDPKTMESDALYTHPNPSPTGRVEWTPQEVRSLAALASADKERLLPSDVAVITGLLDRLSGRRA